MAKTSSALARRPHYFSRPSGSAPIVVVRSNTAPKAKHRRHHGGGGGGDNHKLIANIAAGAALGYLDKGGTVIPTLPILGRAGTLAVACHFFRGHSSWLSHARDAFAAIAAYELSRDGTIAGIGGPSGVAGML